MLNLTKLEDSTMAKNSMELPKKSFNTTSDKSTSVNLLENKTSRSDFDKSTSVNLLENKTSRSELEDFQEDEAYEVELGGLGFSRLSPEIPKKKRSFHANVMPSSSTKGNPYSSKNRNDDSNNKIEFSMNLLEENDLSEITNISDKSDKTSPTIPKTVKNKANVSSSGTHEFGLSNNCPICDRSIVGDNDKFNDHVDMCLNAEAIKELTQNEALESDITGGNRDLQQGESTGSSSHSGSPVLKSPDTSTSPVVRRVRKLNKFALASQATFIAPGDNDTTDDGDGDISALKVKRKKITGRHFIDSEAELSGNDSGDDEEGSQEHYDESFVDDATQATDHGVYLRSIQSQEFRKPAPRVLAPITDDIFSQQVESDDDYAEDSFCVGDSMVEQDSHYDTLDLLEEQANFVQNPGVSKQKVNQQTSKRKRIVTCMSSDDETFSRKNDSPLVKEKRKRISVISSDEDIMSTSNATSPVNSRSTFQNRSSNTSRVNSSVYLSDSMLEAQKSTIIVNSSDVSRCQELISCLRHVKGLRVLVNKVENVSIVTGVDSAVIRLQEADFNLGTNRDKLLQRLKAVRFCYSNICIIIEAEKKKPGERQKTNQRTITQDLIVSQLMVTGVKLLYSSNQMETAEIVASLVEKCERAELCIPKFNFTDAQLQMVQWLQDMPGMGLGAAYALAVSFKSINDLVAANKQQIVEKGVPASVATNLVVLFGKTFQPKMANIAPL